MSDIPKIWLTADGLLGDSFRLARQVLESGFRPTHLVGLWRGGAPIGIAVQEFFDVHGVACDHIAIRTASYTGIDQQSKTVKVYALGYLIDTLNAQDRLLIIDDVFDSGRSVAAVLAELKARCRANMPADVRIATVWYKPKRNQTDLTPDYFVHESDEWLVFPHEIDGLTDAEIRAHKPAADAILAPIAGLAR
ncbi:MAG: phosphoribosyltransferase family protein [Sphingomonadales bacterium]|jgi:hypoxanthine phosphoribosyltransferase